MVIMTKINWKSKLTSRKFWAAIIGFVTALMVAFGVDDLTIEQVVSVISASAVLIAYIIGEGMADAARVSSGNEPNNSEVQTNVIDFTAPGLESEDDK
jgi:uncharacterized membrane protein